MIRPRLAYLPLLLLIATACAQLGIAPAQTFNQKLAYAIGVHTAILQATTNSVTSGNLSSSDATAVLKQADTAKTVLDAAAAANAAGDLTGANNKLALATATLTAIQSYLNTHTTGH
jgi:hypothetical protein